MARKRNPLACPSCQMKLLEVTGHCEGVIVTCPQCGASILVDIEESGRMLLRFEPTQQKPQPIKTVGI